MLCCKMQCSVRVRGSHERVYVAPGCGGKGGGSGQTRVRHESPLSLSGAPFGHFTPSAADKPVMDKPVVDKPVVDKPIVEKPRCQLGYSQILYLSISNHEYKFPQSKKQFSDLSKSKVTSDGLI